MPKKSGKPMIAELIEVRAHLASPKLTAVFARTTNVTPTAIWSGLASSPGRICAKMITIRVSRPIAFSNSSPVRNPPWRAACARRSCASSIVTGSGSARNLKPQSGTGRRGRT